MMETPSAAELETVVSYFLNGLLGPGEHDLHRAWKQWLEWPPDAFGFTSLLLEEYQLHRWMMDPRVLATRWHRGVREIGDHWAFRCNQLPFDGPASEPENQRATRHLEAWRQWSTELPDALRRAFSRDSPDAMLEAWAAVLRAHAVADEACAGLGIPDGNADEIYSLVAASRLSRNGSLARHPTRFIRVLPKFRVPPAGLGARSLSHHAATLRSPAKVSWSANPPKGDFNPSDQRLSILLVPLPYAVDESFLEPADPPTRDIDVDRFGYFRFRDHRCLDLDFIKVVAERARARVSGLLVVVFPEGALNAQEVDELEKSLESYEIGLLVSGIRGDRESLVRYSLVLDGSMLRRNQRKNYRWSLDGRQIRQYGLEWSLNPNRRWHEDIELGPLEVTFLSLTRWLCLCPVICEDLAQYGSVTEAIRSVGPNLLIAITADGPQLAHRWTGRYASVFSDDPGCSVLTLTSLGVARACRDPGRGEEASRTIALWKDPVTGLHELDLPEGAAGLLLSVASRYGTEVSADGRDDQGVASTLVLLGSEAIAIGSVR